MSRVYGTKSERYNSQVSDNKLVDDKEYVKEVFQNIPKCQFLTHLLLCKSNAATQLNEIIP